MKKMIISEEEKNRILGMHQDATKRHYLGEQSAITAANTNSQDVDNKEQILNQYLTKVNEFVPFENKDLNQMLTTLKSGTKEGGNITDLDVVQNFYKNGGQKFIEKVHPSGYKELLDSEFRNYTSLLFQIACPSCNKSSIYQMILNDIINLKYALNLKAQEKAGYMVKTPTWMQQPRAKAVIDNYTKQIGLS